MVRLLDGPIRLGGPGPELTRVPGDPGGGLSADVPALGPRVLYVEQARMDGLEAPTRQRVYVVDPGEPMESAAVIRVFELAVAGSSVGACGRAVRPRFTRDELVERVGCAMALRSDGPVWRGATRAAAARRRSRARPT